MYQKPASSRGFTLIELMTGIVVLSVLLAIAVPSFTETIRNNRTVAQTNELVVALNFARSEATKRGLPVTVCAADPAQAQCAGATANDWVNGWLIFLDVDSGGTVGVVDTGAGDEILLTSLRMRDGVRLTTNNLGFLRYGRSGAPTNIAGAAAGTAVISLGVQHQQCSGVNRRIIAVDRTGRPNLTKVACV